MLRLAGRLSLASALLAIALVPAARPGQAQSCTAIPDQTWATWVDGSGTTRELQLDLLVPGGVPSPPLVVWIHGGGWHSGSRAPLPSIVAALCGRDYAVASVDYRLSQDARWPAQIDDVRGAVRWLRAHAGSYGWDPARIGVWGESAGGQLAAMLGTSADVGTMRVGGFSADLEGTVGGTAGVSSRVQAVVDWYGPSDFLALHFFPTTTAHEVAWSAESQLLGGLLQQVPDRAATADPARYASPDDAPFLVQQGTADTLYPLDQSTLLVEALRAAGVEVTFAPVDGGGHGGPKFFSTPATAQTVYDWLDAHLAATPATRLAITASGAPAEGGTGATLTVHRSGPTAQALTVALVASGGATRGVDYALPESVEIPAGAAAASVALEPLDDTLREGPETVTVALAADAAWAVDPEAASVALALADDDVAGPAPQVSIEATPGTASEDGPTPGTVTVRLDAALAADLDVALAIGGTATPDADYGALPAHVTIPAGTPAVALHVMPAPDDLAETAETVLVAIAPGDAYDFGAEPAATVRVDDADARPIVATMATDPDAAEPGDGGSLVATRTGATDAPLDVALATAGTATPGADFMPLPSTLHFDAGANRVLVPVSVLDDLAVEPSETVVLRAVASAAVAASAHAPAVAIRDDDGTEFDFGDGFEEGDLSLWGKQ